MRLTLCLHVCVHEYVLHVSCESLPQQGLIEIKKCIKVSFKTSLVLDLITVSYRAPKILITFVCCPIVSSSKSTSVHNNELPVNQSADGHQVRGRDGCLRSCRVFLLAGTDGSLSPCHRLISQGSRLTIVNGTKTWKR